MNIFVLNCGSSSLKFQVIETNAERMEQTSEVVLAKGVVERIGSHALITLKISGREPQKLALAIRNHQEAIDFCLKRCTDPHLGIPGAKDLSFFQAVGHRVVHGGEQFGKSVRIDKKVLKGIENCIELAPLHNPANISGIKAISQLFGENFPQVAVFDTAFHATMPEQNYLYAIPYQYYCRHKVRRYGFHGTSHRYVAYRYGQMTQTPSEEINAITVHLGNGCSICSVQKGISFDTSMGMTPVEGLVMGTRCGDMDPAILEYLSHKEGLELSQITTILNKQSGLLGLSGLTNDMRELIEEAEEKHDRRAQLAIDIFVQRVRKYIGAYMAESPHISSILFTGGIGENSAYIREKICKNLEHIGIELEPQRNDSFIGTEGCISSSGSKIQIYVIPTNEELIIARDTFLVVQNAPLREGVSYQLSFE